MRAMKTKYIIIAMLGMASIAVGSDIKTGEIGELRLGTSSNDSVLVASDATWKTDAGFVAYPELPGGKL